MNINGYEEIDEYIRFIKEEFGDDKRFTFIFEPIHDWGGERQRMSLAQGLLRESDVILLDEVTSNVDKISE